MGRVKSSPLTKKRLSFCLLISLRLLVVYQSDHPPVPFDFEVDPLIFGIVCCWRVFSAVAMIWHTIALQSDVDLISYLSACDTVFTVDSALSVLISSIWASYCIRLTAGNSRSDVACNVLSYAPVGWKIWSTSHIIWKFVSFGSAATCALELCCEGLAVR